MPFDQFDSEQFITRFVLLGHMIEMAPKSFEEIGKRILINICKYILEKQTQSNSTDDADEMETMTSSFLQGNFTLLPDEPHADPEISAETRVKVKSIHSTKKSNDEFFLLRSARIDQSDDARGFGVTRTRRKFVHDDLQINSKVNGKGSGFHRRNE